MCYVFFIFCFYLVEMVVHVKNKINYLMVVFNAFVGYCLWVDSTVYEFYRLSPEAHESFCVHTRTLEFIDPVVGSKF